MCYDSTCADMFQHTVANAAEKKKGQQSFSNLSSTAHEGMAPRNVSIKFCLWFFRSLKSSFSTFKSLEYQHPAFLPNFTVKKCV